jgi:prepilin-type N-terminal cleavage/methylation domain-containing protein/prepilin-type processing-associated H-X9-DG protein
MFKLRNSRNVRPAFTLIELLVVIAIIALLAAILFPVFARAREMARRSSCLNNVKQMGLAVMQYTQDYDEALPLQSAQSITDYSSPTNAQGTGPETGYTWAYGHTAWITNIYPYTKSWQIFRCPSAVPATVSYNAPTGNSANSYFVNGVVVSRPTAPRRLASLQSAADIIFVHECPDVSRNAVQRPWAISLSDTAQYTEWVNATYDSMHFEGGNLLYCDGHAKWRKQSLIPAREFGLNSNLIGVGSGFVIRDTNLVN